MLESIAFALIVNVIKSKTKFIFCTPPNTQKWKMIYFIVYKQLSFDELIMNVSIHHETDDKKNYVIILLPPFFSFEV